MRPRKLFVLAFAVAVAASCQEQSTTPLEVGSDLKPTFQLVPGPPITLGNGLPAADPDYFAIVIAPGARSTIMIQDGSDVLFEMFGVLDLGATGVFRFDGPGAAGPVQVMPNMLRSAANLSTPGGDVRVEITTLVAPGTEFVGTHYDVSGAVDLTGARMFEYADLDVLGFSNDEFSQSGSIAGGDLVIRQQDGTAGASGPVVDRVADASISGFATDFFPILLNNILAGGFDPPPTGDIQATVGDLTSALEFELAGSSAAAATGMGSSPAVLVQVGVDVKPTLRVTSQGVIPVTISGGPGLDLSSIDPTTVTFGPAGASPTHDGGEAHQLGGNSGKLMLHFRMQESGIQEGDEEACLSGITTDGVPFFGCDAIQTATGRGLEALVGQLRSVKLFVSHADCSVGGDRTFEVLLNGESLGSAASIAPCACNSDELEVEFDNAKELKSLWNAGGGNTVTVQVADSPSDLAIGYIRGEFTTSARSATLPVFDATGGDASTRDLCDGFVWNGDQSEFSLELP